MRALIKACLPGKWEWAGWGLIGIAAVCFYRAGEIDYAASHVWEDAEKIRDTMIVHGDDCPGHTTGTPGQSCLEAWNLRDGNRAPD